MSNTIITHLLTYKQYFSTFFKLPPPLRITDLYNTYLQYPFINTEFL